MDSVFGLNLLEKEHIDIPQDIIDIAQERKQAREAKDWAKSDELRDTLKEKGWQIEDAKDGYVLEKI